MFFLVPFENLPTPYSAIESGHKTVLRDQQQPCSHSEIYVTMKHDSLFHAKIKLDQHQNYSCGGAYSRAVRFLVGKILLYVLYSDLSVKSQPWPDLMKRTKTKTPYFKEGLRFKSLLEKSACSVSTVVRISVLTLLKPLQEVFPTNN